MCHKRTYSTCDGCTRRFSSPWERALIHLALLHDLHTKNYSQFINFFIPIPRSADYILLRVQSHSQI